MTVLTPTEMDEKEQERIKDLLTPATLANHDAIFQVAKELTLAGLTEPQKKTIATAANEYTQHWSFNRTKVTASEIFFTRHYPLAWGKENPDRPVTVPPPRKVDHPFIEDSVVLGFYEAPELGYEELHGWYFLLKGDKSEQCYYVPVTAIQRIENV